MRITSISNNHAKSQAFGAKLDKNTVEFLRIAKANGANTEKMEKLMEKLHPESTIYTMIHKESEHSCPTICGMWFSSKDKFMHTTIYPTTTWLDAFLGNYQEINKTCVRKVTKYLENIKEFGSCHY